MTDLYSRVVANGLREQQSAEEGYRGKLVESAGVFLEITLLLRYALDISSKNNMFSCKLVKELLKMPYSIELTNI